MKRADEKWKVDIQNGGDYKDSTDSVNAARDEIRGITEAIDHHRRWILAVKRLLIVENPSSRRGRLVSARVRHCLAELGVNAAIQWFPIAGLGDIRPDVDRVLVIGGDGTVNAVAAWLLDHAATVPLGIIAAGTGNNLARGMGIPVDKRDAIELALTGTKLRSVDVVRYTGADTTSSRIFIQSGALGFPAEIAASYDRLRRWHLFRWLAAPTGTYIYRFLALIGILQLKRRERQGRPTLTLRCQLPADLLEENAVALFFGNEKSLGGDFIPCPHAEVDDGKLDICILRCPSQRSYLKLMGHVAHGRHLAIEDLVVYRQTVGPVDVDLETRTPFLGDGDLWIESDHYHLEVMSSALQIVVGM